MEKGNVEEIFYNPQNPYTVGLHQSIPKMTSSENKERLIPIEGSPPDLMHPPAGCPFSSRCPHAMKICLEKAPPEFTLSDTHVSSCWLLHKDAPSVDNYIKGELTGE